MDELIGLPIYKTLSHLRNKDFKVVELVQAHINHIIKNRALNCFITETFEDALNEAKRSDENYSQGTARDLEGIIVGIKDIFCTKNIPTTMASKMLKDFVPTYESTVTHNLRNIAGAIMLGKLNMDEFAMGSASDTSYFGSVVNPWRSKKTPDIDFVAGGSSGGSSAALSANMVQATLGSDTGGSIRQPASFTGTVGIKPTYGRCSRWGMIAFASSLDQAGCFGRNVKDAALVMDSIMSYDEKDSTSINKTIDKKLVDACDNPISGMKIAVPYHLMELQGVDDEVIRMWKEVIDILKSNGAEIIDITLDNLKHSLATYYIIAPAEASSNLSRYDGIRYGHTIDKIGDVSLDQLYRSNRSEGFGDEVKRRIMVGTYVLAAEHMNAYYIKAQKVRRLIYNDFMNVYKKCDVILMPSTPSAAFPIGENNDDPLRMYANDIFTIAANLAGLPAMSVPGGFSDDGLPLGIQLIAPALQEYDMIKVASAIENSIGVDKFLFKNF